MLNDRERAHQQPESAANQEQDRTEQFNELSETSLEERMAVADQIGVPINNIEDAVSNGTMRSDDDTIENTDA